MKKASDLKKDENIHAIIYGASGSGKTHLLGEFAKLGPTFVNDTDYGIETLAGVANIDYEQWANRPGDIKPEGWKSLMTFIEEEIKEPQYMTYAFDSLTTHCDLAASEVLGTVAQGQEIIQLQHYQAIYAKLIKFMTKLRQIPANVILTCHEDVTRNARGQRLVQPLVLGDKFAPKLPIFWNNIWHLSVELPKTEGSPPTRVLRVTPDGEKIVKTQGDNTVATIEPTIEAILEHMKS